MHSCLQGESVAFEREDFNFETVRNVKGTQGSAIAALSAADQKKRTLEKHNEAQKKYLKKQQRGKEAADRLQQWIERTGPGAFVALASTLGVRTHAQLVEALQHLRDLTGPSGKGKA
ncbi:hypothetical protein WJX73_000653 [Symbiochloris irregularis]|uniref:Uncharacterized protein n=1 Tax=Symbiochloris irregularis TaxID=706552 RepID=A0AAW1NVQ5_9CHLO